MVYEKALSFAQDQRARQKVWGRVRETLLKAVFPLGQARVLASEMALFSIVKPEDIDNGGPARDWMNDEQGKSKALQWLSMIKPEFIDQFILPIQAKSPDLCKLYCFTYPKTASTRKIISQVGEQFIMLLHFHLVISWQKIEFSVWSRLGG